MNTVMNFRIPLNWAISRLAEKLSDAQGLCPHRWLTMKGHTVLYDTCVLLETTSGNEILGELCQGRCGKKKD